MRFILGTMFILSGISPVTIPLSNPKLLSRDVLDAQKTKNKLDSRIQQPDPRKYENLRDGKDWLNPFLVIRPEGIEVIWKVSSVERKIISRDDLKKMLISLPVAAWPYGRIIGVQEISIRSGMPDSEVWRKDDGLIEKNKLETNRTLASLGIKIKWWPRN